MKIKKKMRRKATEIAKCEKFSFHQNYNKLKFIYLTNFNSGDNTFDKTTTTILLISLIQELVAVFFRLFAFQYNK
jgi:hypothetical protein